MSPEGGGEGKPKPNNFQNLHIQQIWKIISRLNIQ